jgi:hypothetical protein
MNLVLPTFQPDILLCAVAEWITRQTSDPMASSSNSVICILLQFIWARAVAHTKRRSELLIRLENWSFFTMSFRA